MQKGKTPWSQWLTTCLLLFAMLAIAPEVYAQTKEAGKVLTVTGTLTAQNSAGSRTLERRSPVYVGDMLVTGKNAQAQIRLLDSTIISLKPSSNFRIDDFAVSDTSDSGNRSISTLLKGGFRAITGTVSKRNPADFKVNTPVAIIGVRGTDFSAQMDGKALYVGVWDKRVDVTNNSGKITIGDGEQYRYAYVESADKAPRGLDAAPALLQQVSTNPVTGNLTSETATPLSGFDFANIENFTREQYESYLGQYAQALVSGGYADQVSFSTQAFQDKILVLTYFDNLTFFPGDQRLVGEGTFNELGFFVIDQSISDEAYLSGASEFVYASFVNNANASEQPVLVNNNFNDLLPAHIYDVYKVGQATPTQLGESTTYNTRWGVWNTASGPVSQLTNAFNGNQSNPVNDTVYWIAGQPITTAPTGTITYNTPVMIQGAGNWTGVGALDGVTFNASTTVSVNFNTAAVTGTFAVDVSQNGVAQGTWSATGLQGVFFNDSTKEVRFSTTNNQLIGGTITSSGAGAGGTFVGQINGIVVGGSPTDSAIAGGFRFEKSDDINTHVGGVFLLKD